MNQKHNGNDTTVASKSKTPLLTAFVIVPLSTLAAILLLIFGVATIGGGLSALGGLGYAIGSPFFAGRSGVSGVFVQIGIGLTASGLGLIIFSAFLLLTRSTAVFWVRLLRYIRGR